MLDSPRVVQRCRLAIVAASLLAVAACGGEDVKSYDTPAALAEAVGCRNLQMSSQQEEVFAARSQATCQVGGKQIYLIIFADNEQRNRFVNTSDVFGRPRLLGDAWVITGKAATLKRLQEKVGGNIRN